MIKNNAIAKQALVVRVVLAAAVVLVCAGSAAWADTAFQYGPITDPIQSATFSVDFAAMNAHRTVNEIEINFAQLVDCNAGGGLPDYDLSDDLFGVAALPDEPQVDMGVLETGWISAPIDASFFPALAGGRVGLLALFTDTVDAMFAMDCIVLTIATSRGGFVEVLYGWPVGDENNGFGIDLPDGGDLFAPLPDSIPVGATGTGFDETISSKAIEGIPEPATLGLLLLGCLAVMRRRG